MALTTSVSVFINAAKLQSRCSYGEASVITTVSTLNLPCIRLNWSEKRPILCTTVHGGLSAVEFLLHLCFRRFLGFFLRPMSVREQNCIILVSITVCNTTMAAVV